MELKQYLENLFDERILYDALSHLKDNISLSDQADCLYEDLLQVESIDKRCLLDVGWYPELELNGSFKVVVIENYDWQNPLYEKKVTNLSDLKNVLRESKILYNF